jgi:hypothetical protein
MREDIKTDDKAVERLKRWIIMKENHNIKTREKSDSEMVKAIKKRIEEEANAAEIN